MRRLSSARPARCAFSFALVLLAALLAAAGCSPESEPKTDAGTPVDAIDAGGYARLVDPLSMPLQPTVQLDHFRSAGDCASCHPKHHDEWSQSRHAFAMIDPVFRALVDLRQKEREGQEDGFCTQCHSAIGVRSGDIQPGFRWNDLAPVTLEGVTCEACHKASAIERVHNSGHVLDDDGPLCGNLENPQTVAFHDSAKTPHMGEARFCGGCHDVVETNGLPLERPYEEWLASPAAAQGKPCQDCHMPRYDGTAALGGPQRQGLHEHRFVGVELPVGPGAPALDAATRSKLEGEIAALLGSAAKVQVTLPKPARGGETLDVVVTVHNAIDAHSLPTGSTFLRQVWIDLEVVDADGATVYRSGDLDANGDLRDHWSELDPYGDDDLVTLSSQLLDLAGNPTLFTWHAAEHRRNAIPAGHERTWTYFAPIPATTKGPLQVRATLRFRAYAPFLLRLVGLGQMVNDVPIHDLAKAATAVDVSAP